MVWDTAGYINEIVYSLLRFLNQIANGEGGDGDDTGWRTTTEYQSPSFISIPSAQVPTAEAADSSLS